MKNILYNKGAKNRTCSSCNRTITTEEYHINWFTRKHRGVSIYLCDECIKEINLVRQAQISGETIEDHWDGEDKEEI